MRTTFDIDNTPTVANIRMQQALAHIELVTSGIKSAVASGHSGCDIYQSIGESDITLARAIHELAERTVAYEDMIGGDYR